MTPQQVQGDRPHTCCCHPLKCNGYISYIGCLEQLIVNQTLHIQSDYLWFLTLAYSMTIIFANLFDARLISIGGLITDAGTIIFPMTFLLSDLITEVYGYKYARRAIWCGFLFNLLFILYGQVVIHLPSPIFSTHNDLFAALLALNIRIVAASLISYLVSEPLNAIMMAKLKIKMKGKGMGYRLMLSTAASSGLDSVLFGSLAFYGMISTFNLVILIATMWLIKISIEILGLPLSIFLAIRLKKIEKIDIYDVHTPFNLFLLETTYADSDNRYERVK